MKLPFKAVKVTDSVYWVGAIDWNLRDFHGYSTKRGSTYNAFLIMADKITLVDTVKAAYKDELLARISSVVDPEKIDYIISNHAEMDHSGCLPQMIPIIKPEKVFASKMGVKALQAHFIGDENIAAIEAVEDQGTLNLGNLNIDFYETRMLHWPDSMFSYLREEKFLFSQDGFGMHLASGERFADQLPEEILNYEAEKYFANILLPYSDRILKLIETIGELGLEIDYIAPDHGPIWRENCMNIVLKYKEWAEQKPGKKVVIIYDTMWKSTELMARSVAEGVASKGIKLKVMDVSTDHRSDVLTELLTAGGIVIGCPTINNSMFPTIADVLCYIQGLKPQNMKGFVFGSYGWSGESIKRTEEALESINGEIICPAIKSKYAPTSEILEECYNKGVELAEKLLNA